MADQVKKLIDLVEKNKAGGYQDAARNAMRHAQGIWTLELGIPKPDFSAQERRELDRAEFD